jgi:hypothetical protein
LVRRLAWKQVGQAAWPALANFTGDFDTMRAVISEKLRAHLRQVGSNVLTVTLEPLRC